VFQMSRYALRLNVYTSTQPQARWLSRAGMRAAGAEQADLAWRPLRSRPGPGSTGTAMPRPCRGHGIMMQVPVGDAPSPAEAAGPGPGRRGSLEARLGVAEGHWQVNTDHDPLRVPGAGLAWPGVPAEAPRVLGAGGPGSPAAGGLNGVVTRCHGTSLSSTGPGVPVTLSHRDCHHDVPCKLIP
jgi:hypothetical protein